ncbi:MAG: hypothetical protein JWL81_1198 [Verrucomicrobiales bacterium]|nr:hypothetical protein [Verrucomicrobiales bacterium]
MAFSNSPEANAFISKSYRAGWDYKTGRVRAASGWRGAWPASWRTI